MCEHPCENTNAQAVIRVCRESIPELVRGLEEFRALYNQHWLIERLGFQPPVQAGQRLALQPAA